MTGAVPFFESDMVTIWNADARTAAGLLDPGSVDAIVTSPPYFGLRDYGVGGQIGLEPSPDEYVDGLADTLTSYVDVLKPGGSLWLNLGDSYAGSWGNYRASGEDIDRADLNRKHGTSRPATSRVVDWPRKSLLMIPERVAIALIGRGWILRNRVVWAKPNGMPSSARDRLATKHEALFHLVRQQRYYYDLDAIREEPNAHSLKYGGRYATGSGTAAETSAVKTPGAAPHPNGSNPGDVWKIPTQPYPEAHFAVFPPELIRRPILATVPPGGTVLDPFLGSGTTAHMARRLGRKTVGIELSPDYCQFAADRFAQPVLNLDTGQDPA